jgi:hypothetical protein
MTPIALGKGPGASSRASMAKVIIGGQALSLVISLLIVPVAYRLFDEAGGFLRERLPVGVRERRAWAYALASGAGAVGAWLLLALAGAFATLPHAAQLLGTFLFRAGVLAFVAGIVAYRFSRDRKAAEAHPAVAAPAREQGSAG